MSEIIDDQLSDTQPAEEDAPGTSEMPEAATATSPAPPSFARWMAETLGMIFLAFIVAMGMRTYVIETYEIPTGSMIPTIKIGERVLVNKFIYRFTTPKQGEIVVFADPTHSTPNLIKRVIAVGGQTVDVEDGHVLVDGVALTEPYTDSADNEPGDLQLPVKVPEGKIWVMGDNRTNSYDSRWFGPQPVSKVKGKAILRIWPLNRFAAF